MFINKNVIKTHEHVMFIHKNVIKTNRVLADIPLHKYVVGTVRVDFLSYWKTAIIWCIQTRNTLGSRRFPQFIPGGHVIRNIFKSLKVGQLVNKQNGSCESQN